MDISKNDEMNLIDKLQKEYYNLPLCNASKFYASLIGNSGTDLKPGQAAS